MNKESLDYIQQERDKYLKEQESIKHWIDHLKKRKLKSKWELTAKDGDMPLTESFLTNSELTRFLKSRLEAIDWIINKLKWNKIKTPDESSKKNCIFTTELGQLEDALASDIQLGDYILWYDNNQDVLKAGSVTTVEVTSDSVHISYLPKMESKEQRMSRVLGERVYKLTPEQYVRVHWAKGTKITEVEEIDFLDDDIEDEKDVLDFSNVKPKKHNPNWHNEVYLKGKNEQ